MLLKQPEITIDILPWIIAGLLTGAAMTGLFVKIVMTPVADNQWLYLDEIEIETFHDDVPHTKSPFHH